MGLGVCSWAMMRLCDIRHQTIYIWNHHIIVETRVFIFCTAYARVALPTVQAASEAVMYVSCKSRW